MKPDGVVAVTLGLATLVSGTGGGVVVVTVCSVACGATAPMTCAGSAELTSPKITPSAPMVTTALAPRTADTTLTRCCSFAFTVTTPFGSGSSATMRRGVALMVQLRRGYPARPGKTPEMSDWQPIYRFSRQRYAGSPGTRERRARGRCGEPGGTPNRSA